MPTYPIIGGNPTIDAAAREAITASTGNRRPIPDSSRRSRVPVAWSSTPTDRKRVDLKVPWASTITSPAAASSRLPAPTRVIRKPSWLTVPKASSSLRSCWRSARYPPTSMVATPNPTTTGRQPGRSATPGASRATR